MLADGGGPGGMELPDGVPDHTAPRGQLNALSSALEGTIASGLLAQTDDRPDR